MKITEREFIPVLFASDINTYSMARAFHEAYGVKSMVIGKYPTGPSYNSRIVDFTANERIDQPDEFVKTVKELAARFADKTLIAIGCGDSYAALISQNKGQFPKNVIAPYIDYSLMEELIKKENFYKMCDQYGLDYPDTFVYKGEMGMNFELPFGTPYILKPSNSVAYWEHPFETQKKVYKLNTREELNRVIGQIYGAGYTDSLIIQDFIPGDDSYMRVLTSYSGKDGKVKLMCLGHVLLEEHTPHGLGNHAGIITEQNRELMEKMKGFLEAISYTGFSNFDIKYDKRDKKFKVFEINLRQGRSNYYVTGAGYNLATYIVQDYIENKKLDLVLAGKRKLWLVIPRRVAFRYVYNDLAKIEMKEVLREYGYVNPLFYKGDLGFARLRFVLRNYVSHYVKYRKYMGPEK